MGFEAIDADHDVVGESDEVVRGEVDGLADVALLYVEFFVAGETEDKGILVSHIPVAVFGHLDGGEASDDLVLSRADKHQKRASVEDV